MRLYRGKRKDTGEWVYGYLFKVWEKAYILWGTTNDIPNMVEVIPETVGQSTGLKDKKRTKEYPEGQEIYEGDIVKVRMDFGPGGFKEMVVPIHWHNEYGYQWNYFDLSSIQVIGTTHDKPSE